MAVGHNSASRGIIWFLSSHIAWRLLWKSASLGLSIQTKNLLHEPVIHKVPPPLIFLFLLAIFRKFPWLCNAAIVLEKKIETNIYKSIVLWIQQEESSKSFFLLLPMDNRELNIKHEESEEIKLIFKKSFDQQRWHQILPMSLSGILLLAPTRGAFTMHHTDYVLHAG